MPGPYPMQGGYYPVPNEQQQQLVMSNKTTLEMNFRNTNATRCGFIQPCLTVVLIGASIVLSVMAEERHHQMISPIASFLIGCMIVFSGYYLFLQPKSATVIVSREDDSVTVVQHMWFNRTYRQQGTLSQLTLISAEAINNGYETIGYNVFMQFADKKIVFSTSERSIHFSRKIDELCQFSTRQNAVLNNSCCGSNYMVCRPGFCPCLSLFVVLGLIFSLSMWGWYLFLQSEGYGTDDN